MINSAPKEIARPGADKPQPQKQPRKQIPAAISRIYAHGRARKRAHRSARGKGIKKARQPPAAYRAAPAGRSQLTAGANRAIEALSCRRSTPRPRRPGQIDPDSQPRGANRELTARLRGPSALTGPRFDFPRRGRLFSQRDVRVVYGSDGGWVDRWGI